MDIKIRQAKAEDARAIAVLHIASWRAAYTGIVDQAWLDAQEVDERAKRWLENINADRDKQQEIFLAFQDANLAAFATVGHSRAEKYADYAELWAIYAHPDFFGRGAGKALFHHCAGYARDMGYSQIYVNVLAENKLGRDFYARMGGSVIPNSTGRVELGDQEYDDIKYEWKGL